MSNCTELVSVLDENGITLQVSDEHALLLGYSAAELAGKCVFDFVHPADIELVRDTFRHMVIHNNEVVVTFRFRHISGKWVKFQSRGVPLIEGGSLKGFLVVSNEHRCIDLKALVEKLNFVPGTAV